MVNRWRRVRCRIAAMRKSVNCLALIALTLMILTVGVFLVTRDSLSICLLLLVTVFLLSWTSGWFTGVLTGSMAAVLTAPATSLVSPPLPLYYWSYLGAGYLVLGVLLGVQGSAARRKQAVQIDAIQRRLQHAQASTRHYETLLEEMSEGQLLLDRMNNELALLNTLATAVNSSLDLGQIKTTAVAHLKLMFDIDEAYCYVRSADGRSYVLQADDAQEASLTPAPRAEDDELLRAVLQSLQPRSISAASGDLFLRPAMMAETMRSVVAIPLRARDRLLGLLVLGRNQETAFSREDERFLDSVGRVLAIAMENAHLFQQVQDLSLSDELTGLPNRRMLNLRLAAAITHAGSTGNALCLTLLDLDFFKRINDQYGHPAGDEVLRQFARRVQCEIRNADLCCRIGGEEFALLVADSSPQNTQAAVERLCRHIAESPFILPDAQQVTITVSAGIACFHPQMTADTLLATADSALYAAKAGGRNRVVVAPGAEVAVPAVG